MVSGRRCPRTACSSTIRTTAATRAQSNSWLTWGLSWVLNRGDQESNLDGNTRKMASNLRVEVMSILVSPFPRSSASAAPSFKLDLTIPSFPFVLVLELQRPCVLLDDSFAFEDELSCVVESGALAG